MPTNQTGGVTAKIATKNLELLSELMFYESLANKKNAQYAAAVSDPAVAELVKKHIECHKSRYESLLMYLESHQ